MMDSTHFNGKLIGGADTSHEQGYVRRKAPWHPRANGGYVYEHILVVEQAMGKFLPEGAVVHHMDGDEKNNEPSNLVVCEDQSYHKLLHRRTNALRETGNPDARKCSFCQKWEDPSHPDLYINEENNICKHRSCAADYANNRYDPQKRKERYRRTGH